VLDIDGIYEGSVFLAIYKKKCSSIKWCST
jgi:hypothetical protein